MKTKTKINEAVISLGSNIDPEYHTLKAKEYLHENFTLLKESRFVKTKPIGINDQPDFINGAVWITTPNSLAIVQGKLKRIEQKLGRKTGERSFGPRPIDLDIIVWNNKIVDNDVYTRDFLRRAVVELRPELSQLLPSCGTRRKKL